MPLEQIVSKKNNSQRFCFLEKLRILKEWQTTGDRFLVSKKYGVHPRTLYRWKAAAKQNVDIMLKTNKIGERKCSSHLVRDNLFCNSDISETHMALFENINLLSYSGKDNGQSVINDLNLIRLKYFIKGMVSDYTKDELVGLIGPVDMGKNCSDFIGICIEFAQNKLGKLHTLQMNESSLEQIMLRRDIAFVTSYLRELQEIDSKDKAHISKNIMLPIDQGNGLEKAKPIDFKVDCASNIELRGKASEKREIGFSEKKAFSHVFDSVNSNRKVKNLIKKLVAFGESKSSFLIQRTIKLCSRNDEDRKDDEKLSDKKKIGLLKTAIGSFFIVLIYFAVYMNIVHTPGFFRSILFSFWRYLPVGGH